MGLFSLLGKAAVTIATNLDKVDNISDIVDNIPESINKAKGVFENVKELAFTASVQASDKRKQEEVRLRRIENNANVSICPEMLFEVKYSVPCRYKNIRAIGNDYVVVEDNDKYGVFDINNNLILPIEYEEIVGFSEGLFAVSKNLKYGFVNEKNEVVIDFIYNEVKTFSLGVAPVQYYENVYDENGNYTKEYITSWGYIDKNGNYIISPKYYNAESHNENGLAVVEAYRGDNLVLGKSGVIDVNGEYIIPCNYSCITFYPDCIECSGFNDENISDNFYDLKGTPIPCQDRLSLDAIETGIFKNYTEPVTKYNSEKNAQTKFKGRTVYLYDIPNDKHGWYEVIDEKPICRIEPIYDEDIRILQTKCEGIYSIVKHGGLYGIIKINEKKNEI